MSTGSMISTQRLDNGLDLTFLDQSRQIAKDRWYVCIAVQMNIPIEKKWFDPHLVDGLKFQDIRHVLGDTILFKQKKDRNFVSATQKDDVVKEIFDNTVDTTKRYLGLDVFPAKYILKKYTEKMRHI
jgi:hypothetical protein